MIVILAAFLSGAMFYLAEGLNDVWQLAWIAAPIPLLWLAYGKAPRWQVLAASVAAFAWGEVYLFQCYAGFSLWIVLRVATLPPLLFGAVILFTRLVERRLSAMATLFAFPCAWAAVEYVLGSLLPDGPFTSLAYAQVPFVAGIQVASLFGMSAVTFLLCLFASAVSLLLRRNWTEAGAGLAICGMALTFGVRHLEQPQNATLRVVALADSAKRIESWKGKTVQAEQAASAAYAGAVRDLATKGRIDVVVIPEGAIAMRLQWQTAVLAPLAAAARNARALIVAGTHVAKPVVLNRAFAFSPDGAVGVYAKRHPLQPMDAEIPGRAPGIVNDGRAMAICKDLDFPSSIRSDARLADARLMIVPASDFTRDDWIHARMAILRGVENGFAVARSAFNGLQTISDAQGRVLASTNTARLGMVVTTASVPVGGGPTLYTRIGDIFAWICLSLTLLLGLVACRRKPA